MFCPIYGLSKNKKNLQSKSSGRNWIAFMLWISQHILTWTWSRNFVQKFLSRNSKRWPRYFDSNRVKMYWPKVRHNNHNPGQHLLTRDKSPVRHCSTSESARLVRLINSMTMRLLKNLHKNNSSACYVTARFRCWHFNVSIAAVHYVQTCVKTK